LKREYLKRIEHMLTDKTTNNVVEVALQLGRGLSCLTYLRPHNSPPSEVLVGRRVLVELGKRKVTGIVTRETGVLAPPGITLKEISFASDAAPVLTQTQLKLAQFVADYYEAPYFECLKLCLPKLNAPTDAKVFTASDTFLALLKTEHAHKSKSTKVKRSALQSFGFSDAQINDLLAKGELALGERAQKTPKMAKPLEPRTLTDEQEKAVHSIIEGPARAFLLEGITGSGKTEVYLNVAKAVLAQGKSVLFIVPEIALTPQLFERLHQALDEEPALIHSHIASGNRDATLENIRSGKSKVIIGARSALFCPALDLGLIVVDEEHDSGFKQSESPRYHARDVALWRAYHEGARIILGSATPSLESLHNVEKGLLHHVRLTKRASGSSLLPQVEIIDLRERRSQAISRLKDRSASHGAGVCILASPLRDAIEETLASKQQVILFLNRRGYASHLLCEDCGGILKCPDCSITLTYHKKANLLRCHQCSYTEVFKTQCKACPSGLLVPLGLGTERVEKELQLSFPTATVARFDRESVSNPKHLEATLEKFHSGEIHILIGTQMIAKGHDFPNVTLVGVVLADSGLSMPDFRANERSFQLLTQVAGRAGRRDLKGRVIIQTYNPAHPAIVFAKNHDVAGFTKIELEERKQFFYPPYSRAALLRIEIPSEIAAEELATAIKSKLDMEILRRGLQDLIVVLGPAPCPMLKLRKYFRWQVFLKCKTVNARKQLLESLRHDQALNKHIAKVKGRLIIDVDPVQML
jgi:primosomal protein N' (replication factor Y)